MNDIPAGVRLFIFDGQDFKCVGRILFQFESFGSYEKNTEIMNTGDRDVTQHFHFDIVHLNLHNH